MMVFGIFRIISRFVVPDRFLAAQSHREAAASTSLNEETGEARMVLWCQKPATEKAKSSKMGCHNIPVDVFSAMLLLVLEQQHL